MTIQAKSLLLSSKGRPCMVRFICLVAVFTLSLASCRSGNTETVALPKCPEGDDLSEFIIGRWESSTEINDSTGTYTKQFVVEFKDKDTVSFEWSTPSDGDGSIFDYRFIDENTLLVENNRAKRWEWKSQCKDQYLILCFESDGGCHTFTRLEK